MTYTVKTGNPDLWLYQYYFRQPGVLIKTNQSEIHAGVDVRGDGGMVVAPPSLHPSGNRYRIESNVEPADPPQWLLDLVIDTRPEMPTMSLSDLSPLTPEQIQYGGNIFLKKCRKFSALPAGTGIRNGELNNLGFLAGRIMARDCFDLEFAEGAVREYAASYIAQDGDREAMRTFKSGVEAGYGSPWEPQEASPEDAGFGDAPLPAGASLTPLPYVRTYEEEQRRRNQIAENIAIGKGVSAADCPTSPVVSLDEMLTNFCKIHSGNRVIDFRNPRSVFSYAEWKSRLKQSVTFKEVKGDPYHDHATGGKTKKPYDTLDIWNSHPSGRKEAETITFRPGYEDITTDPQFKSAANTWRTIKRAATESSCELFLTHVEYLFGDDSEGFLDWLGHIEQMPGELPSKQWIHVSPSQGTGRNLLASILCRVWAGYTAVNFDLPGALRNGFNEELSQKLLVTVDEIDAGGSNTRWSDSETLKSMVTATHRPINEKYGKKVMEWNCCRWLIFSNHMTALPLTEGDRRFNVVKNTRPRLPDTHYEQLFAALKDPEFIASVAWMLKTRDISKFNPGEHAVMSEAKLEMIGASKSEVDDTIADLIETHPADVIDNNALGVLLNNQSFGKLTAHQRHALDRAGTQSYGKPIKIAGKAVRVRILRNPEFWKAATPPQIQAELIKGTGAHLSFASGQ